MTNVKFCSKCNTTKSVDEFDKNKSSKSGYQTYCKICRYTAYYMPNKSIKKEYDSKRYFATQEEHSIFRKKHYINNIDYYKKYNSEYYAKNKDLVKTITNKYSKSIAIYKNFYNKLTIDEDSKLSEDGISLEVKCKYCNKYFIPTNSQVVRRVRSLNNFNTDANNYLYCSTNCKVACPVYNQKKYPKGFKKATSREVDSIIRQMCFKRDGWACQKCGKTVEEVELHCHHVEGYKQNPLLSSDIYNVVTFCKDCHKEVHKLPGCTYNELKCLKA